MINTHAVVRYRIQNWHAYNRALINRGRLTVWFDEQAIAAWRNTAPATGPGAPRVWSCSQIVERWQLEKRPKLVAVHKESYDGIVHEYGF